MTSRDPDESTTVGQLLDAALNQFAQHGFAKTTMSDIAGAAGLSRTSLYKHYRAKDEVFNALSQRMNQRARDDVLAAASAPGTSEERLTGVIHARIGWVYDLLHAAPFGRELINEKNRICGGHIIATNDSFEKLLAGLMREVSGQSGGRTDDMTATARTITHALNGVLETAASQAEAEADVGRLIHLLVHGLAGQGGTRKGADPA